MALCLEEPLPNSNGGFFGVWAWREAPRTYVCDLQARPFGQSVFILPGDATLRSNSFQGIPLTLSSGRGTTRRARRSAQTEALHGL